MSEHKKYHFVFGDNNAAQSFAEKLDKETQERHIAADLCVKGEEVFAIVNRSTKLISDSIPNAEEITIQPETKKRRFW